MCLDFWRFKFVSTWVLRLSKMCKGFCSYLLHSFYPYIFPSDVSLCSLLRELKTSQNDLEIHQELQHFKGRRSQYFICEQCVLCELPTFQSALFIMFAAYYVFNLEYPKQECVLFSPRCCWPS